MAILQAEPSVKLIPWAIEIIFFTLTHTEVKEIVRVCVFCVRFVQLGPSRSSNV